jgi:hypothetical protein
VVAGRASFLRTLAFSSFFMVLLSRRGKKAFFQESRVFAVIKAFLLFFNNSKTAKQAYKAYKAYKAQSTKA